MSALKKTHSGDLIITRAITWSASDINDLPSTPGLPTWKGFSVNADGNISIVTFNLYTNSEDPAVVITVKAGIIYPIAIKRITSTNTTATGIVIYG
jgi:hypothetical protein